MADARTTANDLVVAAEGDSARVTANDLVVAAEGAAARVTADDLVVVLRPLYALQLWTPSLLPTRRLIARSLIRLFRAMFFKHNFMPSTTSRYLTPYQFKTR